MTPRDLISKLNKIKDRGEGKSVKGEKLKKIQKTIRLQIFLSVGAILLVVVLLFAMTAAWYTNVAKTGSLNFHAESWGYDPERITVSETDIGIAPGVSGVVPLSINNSDNSENVRIGVAISKSPMNDELRKRLYFYASATENRNGETISKIYIGATGSDTYYYDLLAGSTFSMSDSYCTDAPLKWEWVYDMLGYYFRGSADAEGVTVNEYIRPIEYDYDSAQFDLNGELVSVGNQTKAQVLTAVSSADGFSGTINENLFVTFDGKKYYPVSVDADGNGVWAYLCSKTEIEEGFEYDSEIAASASTENPINATANIIISATKLSAIEQTVSSVPELVSALTSGTADVVALDGDLALSEAVTVPANTDIAIDLNGHDLEYTGSETTYTMFSAENGSSVTLMNGTVTGNGQTSGGIGTTKTSAVSSDCGDVTLSHVTINGIDTAVNVGDTSNDTGDSIVRIQDCEFDTTKTAILIYGNGELTSGKSRLIIQNSTITGGYFGISGNGTATAGRSNWGTDVVIINSTVSGYYCSVYQPQQKSTMQITGSTLSGITGLVIKGGSVTLTDTTVNGTGPYTAAAPAGGGFTDTGDAVYIEGGYNWSASVTIEGNCVLNSANAYALDMFGVAGKGQCKFIVNGGTFSGALGAAEWNGVGVFEIYGGSFTGAVNALITRYDD